MSGLAIMPINLPPKHSHTILDLRAALDRLQTGRPRLMDDLRLSDAIDDLAWLRDQVQALPRALSHQNSEDDYCPVYIDPDLPPSACTCGNGIYEIALGEILKGIPIEYEWDV